MKEKSRQKRLRLLAEAKKKPAVFTVYIVLRLIVVAILVSSILRGEYENAAICLLVLFLFLSLPTVGINLDKNVAAIVALTLNTSAFNAEIWRNAFRTFPREQREAAESVGMRRWTYFRYIMLPQMWIESLPALVNEMSFLIKGSPAIAVIGVVDLTRVTNRISSVTYEPLSPILAAGLLYVVIIGMLLKLQGLAERKAKRLAR